MLNNRQREQLEVWIRAIGPRAVVYARSLVHDLAKAEDIVQECLYRILRKADTYDIEKDGMKLLFTAISNLAINESTRRKFLISLDANDSDNEPITLPDPKARTGLKILEDSELQNVIQKELQKLPPLQCAAIELRALGMSKEEIGEALGVTATNAGVLVHRGRQALSKALASLLSDESK